MKLSQTEKEILKIIDGIEIIDGSFVFHVVFKVFNLGFNSPQC